ncbi:MAG: hypothetical protein V3S00_04850 [Dehalococcoidia bacterium]
MSTVARPIPLLTPLLALAALVAIACGSGSPQPPVTPTASPSASPAIETSPQTCRGDIASEPPDLTIYGADADDFLADRFSLASGDFNGDDMDDILVGAPKADGPDESRQNAGEAYVILGSDPLTATIDLAEPEAADITIFGEEINDNFGFTVAAGDVNGDGIDDILIGGRFASHQDRMLVGKVYIIFGRADMPAMVDTAAGDQDVTIVGVDGGDFAGIALGSGDVNGDGADDVIIGASNAGGPRNGRVRSGEVYVVTGGDDLPSLIDLGQEEPFFTVFGRAESDALPNYITTGDLDGDGNQELLLGAPFASRDDPPREQAGEAYIIPVPAEGGVLDLASGQGFTTITGNHQDHLGFYVAAGDVNGDGLDDALITAKDTDGPDSDSARANSGSVLLLLGSQALPSSLDLAETSPDVTIHGASFGDRLGFTVAAADIDNDGIADVLMGAPTADSCENSRPDGGNAYVLLGRPDLADTIDLSLGEASLSIFGAEAGDELGFALAAGDINGDGKDDLLIGALLADGPDNAREDAGEAYIILSR